MRNKMMKKTTVQKEHDNISEILMNKGMKSKEMIGNHKLNVKVNSISQVKQISNELIQDNNYYTNLTRLGHEQREQLQPTKILERGTASTDKENETQTKKIKKEENLIYTIENMKDKKEPTEKYGRNIRVQHFEERIEEIVTKEIRSIRTRTKQKEHDHVTKEVSNSQLQQETFNRG